MNRKIKFRGKNKYIGWVFGQLAYGLNGELITDKWDTRVSSIRSNFSEEDIKTILTKEQYMANCYKVGGEDEKI